jgi:hypothetical protein
VTLGMFVIVAVVMGMTVFMAVRMSVFVTVGMLAPVSVFACMAVLTIVMMPMFVAMGMSVIVVMGMTLLVTVFVVMLLRVSMFVFAFVCHSCFSDSISVLLSYPIIPFRFNPDSAVEGSHGARSKPSAAKTMRSASERAAAVSAVSKNAKQMEPASRRQKRL